MNIVNDITTFIKKINLNKKTGIMLIAGFLVIIILFISELDFETEKEDVNSELSDEDDIFAAMKKIFEELEGCEN